MTESKKRVEDLVEGDLVDLQSCPYLKNHAMAAFEFGRVTHVERETNECIVIGYEGIDHIGYPVGTVLTVSGESEKNSRTNPEAFFDSNGLLRSWDTADPMPKDWTGIAKRKETLFFIGKERSETSYTALQAKTMSDAQEEVTRRNLVSPTEEPIHPRERG